MPLSFVSGRFAPLAAAVVLSLALTGCANSGFVTKRTQGYEIPDSALEQIRPGQSQALVNLVLGSPQLTNDFTEESAYYYSETKIEQTAFGLTTVKERTVVAIYFDKNKKVKDKAIYSLTDGKVVAIEGRRTPSFGEDRTFIESLISSI